MDKSSSNSTKTSASSTQPPSYTEADTRISLLRKQRSPLVVQLQVWHHNSEGRSPAHNNGFAALFRDLRAWKVIPLEAEGIAGPGSHDQYVPVEVRFRHRILAYNDRGESPVADVGELFYKVAPQFIYQFFIKIRSAPHNTNIFPVGVPDEFSSRYIHAYNLKPPSIRVNESSVPAPARTNDAQSWLMYAVGTTANGLGILAAIIIVYFEYQKGSNGNDPQGIQRLSEYSRFLMDVNVPKRFPMMRGLFDQCMEARLERLENKHTLSDQDLYELLHDSHSAVVELSAVKRAVFPLVVLLERENSRAIQAYRVTAAKSAVSAVKGAICGLAAAIAAVFLFSNPGGWDVCGAGLIGGVAGASLGFQEQWLWVRLAVKQLNMYASQAQVAIVMVFCAQLMRKRIDETLPEHDRRAILCSFGVDANGLGSAVYREELVRLRLRPFREWNGELHKKMNEVMADVDYELSE
ncbi:hypothetical protein CSOJ01_15072 [Colletotrichum sojae]|uniref:Uncharacterized protein n=1 Tax=Colletotrichum sojae TaxID=2175907 RepID=A0A8H6INW5_9PEZI|nr:hypothetical protein CSOJ01_15072 [Colletotrichum sojae]